MEGVELVFLGLRGILLFFFFLIYLIYFIFWLHWVFIAARGLSLVCGAWAFSSCGKWGLRFVGGARASHCSGLSCCGARALGACASAVVAHGLSSCGTWALERRLSSCGARA